MTDLIPYTQQNKLFDVSVYEVDGSTSISSSILDESYDDDTNFGGTALPKYKYPSKRQELFKKYQLHQFSIMEFPVFY